jgi:hypothetical protein
MTMKFIEEIGKSVDATNKKGIILELLADDAGESIIRIVKHSMHHTLNAEDGKPEVVATRDWLDFSLEEATALLGIMAANLWDSFCVKAQTQVKSQKESPPSLQVHEERCI